jgi:hypothetical protein
MATRPRIKFEEIKVMPLDSVADNSKNATSPSRRLVTCHVGQYLIQMFFVFCALHKKVADKPPLTTTVVTL